MRTFYHFVISDVRRNIGRGWSPALGDPCPGHLVNKRSQLLSIEQYFSDNKYMLKSFKKISILLLGKLEI